MSRVNRWTSATLATVWFAAITATAAQAQSVIRGPYLQLGTPKSVVVRWRTDVATDSHVCYGTEPVTLTTCVPDPTLRTDHTVTLDSLLPDTVYFYAIGTTTKMLAGGTANHFVLTAPLSGTPKPTRIWVLGDSGTANDYARAVRDAYYTFTGSRHTDLWLMLGDNAYSSGTDSEYQAAVFNMYPEMLRKSVLWPTLGNHDGHSADSATQSGPYYDIFTLPRNAEAGGVASGTEAYYSFDYGNMHFIVLDSFDSDRSPGGPMMTWLQQDLLATTQAWIIAFWHHPPYSKGSHDSDSSGELTDMRKNALPLLEQGGVDLVLAGHSHSYERSFLLDGHYGTSSTLLPSMILDHGDGRPTGNGAYEKPAEPPEHKGAVYAVAGSSGHTGGGSLNHPVMYISLNILGSLVLDVDGNRLDATFLDSTGAVRDTFTIVKGATCAGVASVSVAPGSASVEVGATLQLSATPADGSGAPLARCAVTWATSAAAAATVGASGLVTGVAVAEGPATITATSGSVSGTSTITVVASTNRMPVVTGVSIPPVPEGSSASLSATFTDPDSGDSHTATIDWGDGSPIQAGAVSEGNPGTVTGSHVYANDGVYTVTVTVRDNRSVGGPNSAAVTVNNVLPTANAGGPYSGVAGVPVQFTGSATDPGADVLTYEWDFNYNGTFVVGATGKTVQHTYAQGSYTVGLRVWDGAGFSPVAPTTVTVAAPPGATALQSPTADAPVTSGAGDNNGFQTNPKNAYLGDGLFAVDTNSGSGTSTKCTSSSKDKHLFYNYGLPIPPGATIKGIEVRLDAKVDSTSGSPKFCVQLSWDGGANWTAAKSTPTLKTSAATYMLGSATDTWGRSWTVDNLTNTSFRVRVISVASSTSRDFSLDWIAVRVTYQP